MTTKADPTEFAGKRVLISGGTKGLGRATIDRFLAGGLSASRLYQTTGLEERLPPFAWRPYARLLEEARRRGVRVRLIEPGDEPDFFRRHDAALAAIATLAAKGPVVALLGEIRLSDLGLSYARALQGRPRTRIVCDVTGPWFAHLRTGGSGRTAARLGPDLFAIVEQSPLAKLLTFVEWYALEEEGLDGSRLGSLFGRFARTIAERFELPPLPRRGPRVFAPGDPRVLAHVAAAGCCDAAALDHLEGRLRAGESRFLPEAGAVYLGHPSRSHVAEEAAHYVRACAGGAGIAAGTEDAFWSVAVHEMAGYLGSKVLAPYRRPPALPAANDRGPLDAEALAHVYGYQLAERIWRRLPDDPALSDLVRTLFMKDLVEPGAAKDLYFRSLSAVAGRNR